VGLLGELSGFEDERAVAKWSFYAGWIHRHGWDPFVYRQEAAPADFRLMISDR